MLTPYPRPRPIRKRELEGLIGEGAETVEPILDSFGGYSTDNLSNFYYPYIIVLLMIFRDEVGQHECHNIVNLFKVKLMYGSCHFTLLSVVCVSLRQ